MHAVWNNKLSKTKQNLVWQTGSYSNVTDDFKVEKINQKKCV